MADVGFSYNTKRAMCKIPAVNSVYFRRSNVNPPAGRMCFERLWTLDYPYTDSGVAKAVRRNAPWFARSPGVACLFPPGIPFWEDPTKCPVPMVFSYVTFFRGEDLDLLKYVDGGKGYCVFHDRAGRLGDLLRETAFEAAKGSENSFWGVNGNLFRIAEILHSSKVLSDGGGRVIDGDEEEVQPDDRQLFVERVREYLRGCLTSGVGISELARHVGASASSLSHKYKALTGESPMRTLALMRVAAAKSLLSKGESMKNVAERTGFCDVFHMSKAFRRLTGSPPSQFRL